MWETYLEIDWNGRTWEVVGTDADHFHVETYVAQGDGTRRIVRHVLRRDAVVVPQERRRLRANRPQRCGPHHVL